MYSSSPLQWLASLFLLSSILLPYSFAATTPPYPAVKAVNLGGWLVAEGYITPWLFDKIPNNDLLDGTQVQFRSTLQNKYLSAENGGGSAVVANRASPSGWETFRLWRISETSFKFRVFKGSFVGLNNQGGVVAIANPPRAQETFEIIRNPNDKTRVRIRAPNGSFLQANADGSVTADHSESSSWGNDPSVFLMTIVSTMRGEFQVTNGYGPQMAATVMREHWKTYIRKDDFCFMFDHGINAVRIPVGWWIAHDSNPPSPYVGGSLEALDNAFQWAQECNLKVIVDLHAVPGSQNGKDHSGSRDGSQEWGDNYIDQTIEAIDFLARKFAGSPSLLAVELINEPLAPGVGLDTLKSYYRAGYNTVRKYSNAYVIMSNRLGPHDRKELLQFASSLPGSVIDVHYYNLYDDNKFKSMTVQQNIDYVNSVRSSVLSSLMNVSNGPSVFVGEWTAEWEVKGASQADYTRFAQAQLEVYGRATFGWAYWSYKNAYHHWSLRWMIENGYISFK